MLQIYRGMSDSYLLIVWIDVLSVVGIKSAVADLIRFKFKHYLFYNNF